MAYVLELSLNDIQSVTGLDRPWLTLKIAPGVVVPPIQVHPGLPEPRRAEVSIGPGSKITGCIVLWGAYPKVRIGANVVMSDTQIACGDTAEIEIGDDFNCLNAPALNARHNGRITIGKDNLWSARVYVATDDMHAIRDVITGKRINARGGHVAIGNHVWLGFDVMVKGGADIGDGAVVGARALVTGRLPGNTVSVGQPARVVQEGVTWTHEDLP